MWKITNEQLFVPSLLYTKLSDIYSNHLKTKNDLFQYKVYHFINQILKYN